MTAPKKTIRFDIRSIAQIFARGFRRRSEATLRRTNAYRSLFSGNGTPADAGIVLSDLAAKSGFYGTMALQANPTPWQAGYAEGARSVFTRIRAHLHLTDAELMALEDAVRAEQLANIQEGEA